MPKGVEHEERREASDRNAELIVESLGPLVQEGKLRIRPGGYVFRRGRGRLIVEPVKKT